MTLLRHLNTGELQRYTDSRHTYTETTRRRARYPSDRRVNAAICERIVVRVLGRDYLRRAAQQRTRHIHRVPPSGDTEAETPVLTNLMGMSAAFTNTPTTRLDPDWYLKLVMKSRYSLSLHSISYRRPLSLVRPYGRVQMNEARK